jgi:ribosomal protein L7/L12
MAKAKLTKDDVKEYIKNMPVFELAELVKELEEELGVSAAAPMAAMPMAMPAGVAAAGAEAAGLQCPWLCRQELRRLVLRLLKKKRPSLMW